MTGHTFCRQQLLPLNIDEAWDFFSDPGNLRKITPASLDFKIISAPPQRIYEGLELEYRVKPLLGIPVSWISRIRDVKPPVEFVDIQVKGPYRYWHHHHYFEKTDSGGVLMRDTITYGVPMGEFFPWINDRIVLKELNNIFDHRRNALRELFG